MAVDVEAQRKARESAQAGASVPPSQGSVAVAEAPTEAPATHLIHILKDGWTAWGRTWYRGQEIEVTEGTPEYAETCDLQGKSWLNLTAEQQYAFYGEAVFAEGPWPGQPWEASGDPEAAERELKRRRSPTARAR